MLSVDSHAVSDLARATQWLQSKVGAPRRHDRTILVAIFVARARANVWGAARRSVPAPCCLRHPRKQIIIFQDADCRLLQMITES